MNNKELKEVIKKLQAMESELSVTENAAANEPAAEPAAEVSAQSAVMESVMENLADQEEQPIFPKNYVKKMQLTDKVVGEFNLETGDSVAVVTAFDSESFSAPFDLKYRVSKTGTRSVLDEKLTVSNLDDETNTKYTFIDETGESKEFEEKYYYVDNKTKYYVNKNKVSIDLNGNLSYYNHEVKKEQVCGAYTLIPEINDFINSEMIEQRQQEQVELEESVKNYEASLKDYVLIDTESRKVVGNFYNLTKTEADNNFKRLETESDRKIMTKSELFQINSLWENIRQFTVQEKQLKLQEEQLNSQKDQINLQKDQLTVQEEMNRLQDTQLNYSIQQLDINRRQNNAQIESLSNTISYCGASKIGDYNLSGTINFTNVKNSNDELVEENVARVQNQMAYQDAYNNRTVLTSSNSLIANQKNNLSAQRTKISEQINLGSNQQQILDAQLEQVAEQEKLLKGVSGDSNSQLYNQMKCVAEQKALCFEQLNILLMQIDKNLPFIKQAFNKYFTQKAQLELVVKQTPVNYIKDKNGFIKGFNKFGNIVCMIDSSNNAIAFEYGSDDKILSVYDKDGALLKFDYESATLYKVTDKFGRVQTFETSGNKLSKITYASGFVLEISYANRLQYIKENGVKYTTCSYGGDNRLISISKTFSGKTVSSVTVTYNFNNVTFTYDDGSKEVYGFNSDGEMISYTQWTGDKYVREQYSETTLSGGKSKTTTTDGNYTNKVTAVTEVYDGRENLISKSVDWQSVSDTVRVKTEATYTYDDDNNPISAEETQFIEKDGVITSDKKLTNYTYNLDGKPVKVESYIEGAEETLGKNITVYEYDEDGVQTKSISWNTLDSSTKFYSESEESSEVSCGVDPDSGKVMAITQSTEDGEGNTTDISYDEWGRVTKVKSGNTEAKYEYDYKDRVTRVELNGSEYLTNTYNQFPDYTSAVLTKYGGNSIYIKTTNDKEGNVKTVDYISGSVVKTLVSNEYNEGKLTKSTDGVTGTSFSCNYDNYGNLKNYVFGNVRAILRYNEYGQISSKSLSGAIYLNYAYTYKDDISRALESITLPTSAKVCLDTDVYGRNKGKEIISSSGARIAGEYITYKKVGDKATNLPCTEWFATGEVIKDNLHYKYDSHGNIVEITKNRRLISRYAYDSLNRLIREDNKDFKKTYLFSYDNNGNIINKSETDFTLKDEIEECEFTNHEYVYDGDKLISHDGQSVTYNNGEMRSYLGNPLVWSYVNKLTRFGATTFEYDGEGRRIKKTHADNVETTYTYDGEGNLITQGNALTFMYDNTGVAGIMCSSGIYYYRKDVQGNIIAILDSNGQVVVEYKYDAWGNHTVSGSNLDLGKANPFRYRGYYYDTETGLYYLKTRYYDPRTGRFISPDDISYLDPETINGLNLYAYCGNNPVMNVDPEGTSFTLAFLLGLLISAGVGAIVGAGSYVVSEVVSYTLTGVWTWSWGMFLGSIIGGAITGAITFVLPGTIAYGAAIEGFLSTAIGMGLENAFGEANHSFWEIAGTAVVSSALAYTLGKFIGALNIPWLDGRGSLGQVTKQMMTKLRNNTARLVTAKTFLKILAYQGSYSILNALVNGYFDSIQTWIYINDVALPFKKPIYNPFNHPLIN